MIAESNQPAPTTGEQTAPLLAAALRLHEQGCSVVPLEPRGKEPMINWLPQQQQRAGPDQIRAWWTKWPEANLGIVTGRISGVVVVDVDHAEGLDQALERGPTSRIVKTGRGYHLHYEYPPDQELVPNRVGDDGIDIRADGGVAVMPPSVHESGTLYSYHQSGTRGTCPAWVLDQPTIAANKGQHWIAHKLQHGVARGERNSTCAGLAGFFYGHRIAEDIAQGLLQNWNLHNRPPMTREDVDRTVSSVYRTAARRQPPPAAPRAVEGESEFLERYEVDITEQATGVIAAFDDPAQRSMEMQLYGSYALQYAGTGVTWLVDGWLPDNSLHFIVGPPGSHKTWMGLDLAMAVAGGYTYLGERVNRQGPVLLYQQEDARQTTAERLVIVQHPKVHGDQPMIEVLERDEQGAPNAWQFNLPEHVPLYVHPANELQLNHDGSLGALEEQIRRIKPVLVVIDPLYVAGGELDGYLADTAQELSKLKRLREVYQVGFVIVHHSKKGDTEGRERGWGSQFLNAASETQWQLYPDEETGKVRLARYFKGAGQPPPVQMVFDIRKEDADITRYNVYIEEDEDETGPDQGLEAEITRLLQAEQPLRAADLANKTKVHRTTISRALRSLRQEGTVTQDSQFRYSLAGDKPVF